MYVYRNELMSGAYLVNRGATGLGELVVVERRRIALSLNASFVYNSANKYCIGI
jgi:hypothetical protein